MASPVDTTESIPAEQRPTFVSAGHDEYFGIRGWKVFRWGTHKGKWYSPETCRQIVANFRKASGPKARNRTIVVKGKLGHHKSQTMAQSLGFPALGIVTDCRYTPDGWIEIDMDNLPRFAVGDDGHRFDFRESLKRSAYPEPSIELEWGHEDPDKPGQLMDGPVMVAVAFLGEEPPGVRGVSPPPVVDYPERFSVAFGRDTGSPNGSRFSITIHHNEVQRPMRDELLKKLAAIDPKLATDPEILGLPDDELAEYVAQQTAIPADTKFGKYFAKRFAAAPAPTEMQPEPKPMEMPPAAMAKFSEMEKKIAELSKFAEQQQDVAQKVAFSAFVSDVDATLAEARKAHRISKNMADTIRPLIVGLGHTKATATFSAKSSDGKETQTTALDQFKAGLSRESPNLMFAESIDDGAAAAITTSVQQIEQQAKANAEKYAENGSRYPLRYPATANAVGITATATSGSPTGSVGSAIG